MTAYLTHPLAFLIKTLFGVYVTLLFLRFLLAWVRLDPRNRLHQFVLSLTAPAVMPWRRFLPTWRRMDLSPLLVAWLVKTAELGILGLLFGLGAHALLAPVWAIADLIALLISIFLFAVVIRALLSWLNPDPYNPATELLDSLTEPLLLPARRRLPNYQGIDLSPMVVALTLILLQMLLLPPLIWLTGKPF